MLVLLRSFLLPLPLSLSLGCLRAVHDAPRLRAFVLCSYDEDLRFDHESTGGYETIQRWAAQRPRQGESEEGGRRGAKTKQQRRRGDSWTGRLTYRKPRLAQA